MPLDPSVFVHSHALCESDEVGPRTRVWAFAHVMAGARVGADCNVCDHVFIEAGAIVGDRVTMKNNVLIWDCVVVESDVFLGPNVVFTNDLRPRAAAKKTAADFLPTVVRTGASIGANSTILCGTEIGRHAMIGAGSVVIRDVPAHTLVAGNPARRIGLVCTCGNRLDDTLACGCGRAFAPDSEGALGLRPA